MWKPRGGGPVVVEGRAGREKEIVRAVRLIERWKRRRRRARWNHHGRLTRKRRERELAALGAFIAAKEGGLLCLCAHMYVAV